MGTAAIAVLLLLVAAQGASAVAPVTVTGLTVDHMASPKPIDDAHPSLGWQLQSFERGVVQTGYEVQVATSEAALAAGTYIWDSGQKTSAESVETPYEGPEPASGSTYFWRVRVWTTAGGPSAWSATASWQTALMHESEWGGAQWITPKSVTDAANWSDYEMRVDFTIAAGAAGVVFRERDPDDFYMWQIQVGTEHVLLRPHIQQEGAFHLLDEVSLDNVLTPGEVGTSHELKIVADGATITTFIDGTEVEQLTNPTFTTGGIGFRSGANAEDASFDNLVVDEVGGGELFSDDFGTSPDPAFPGSEIEAGSLRVRHGALDLISTAPQVPLLRKGFGLAEPAAQVAAAHVYAFGLGLYEMRLSGHKVGNQVFAPAVSDYGTRLRYQTYDVGSQLVGGENVLGMTLAEGYGPAFSPSGQRWLGPRQAKALLEVRFDDGTTQRVVTDESWRWSEGPVISAGIYAGESYDANRPPLGWDLPGFDAGAWQAVGPATAPGGRTEADTTPSVRVIRSTNPISVTAPAGSTDTYVYDLGEDISGWARITMSGEPGTAVQLRYAEDLQSNGHIDTTTNGFAESIDRFVAGGNPSETFEPTFTYHGFRYVEVVGPATAPALVGQVVHADLPQLATFRSSDPLLDAIFEQNRRTMINNAMSYPTDNPVRNERTGPGMDVQAYADASTGIFGADRFFAAYLQEISVGYGGRPDMNEANIPLAWDLYEQYGDRRALEAAYPGMASTMSAYESQAPPGLVWGDSDDDGFGDWCAPVPVAEANGGVGGGDVGGYLRCFSEVSLVNTALAYRNSRITAMAAKALGKPEAVEFEELAERIETAFEAHFAKPDGYGTEERQVTSVLPLAFGMVPTARRSAVAEGLVDQIEGPDAGHLDTGIFGTRFLVDALVAAGRPDVALGMLDQTTYPSFGYELGFGSQIGLTPGHGATTDWEEWTYSSAMESHDHAMFGGIDASFLTKFAGIESTGPGYSKIRIAPVTTAGLTHAAASIATVRGTVASSWSRSGHTGVQDVTVPGNASAEVVIPVATGDEVLESGRPAAGQPGVTFLRHEGGAAIYRVGSGEYHFTAAPPTPSEPEGEETPVPSEPSEQGEEPSPQNPPRHSDHGSPARGSNPAPAGVKLKAAATVTAAGRAQVTLVCMASCLAAGPKLAVVAAAPKGKPVLRRVRKKMTAGRLVFGFHSSRRRLPHRLRLDIRGLPQGEVVLFAKLLQLPNRSRSRSDHQRSAKRTQR